MEVYSISDLLYAQAYSHFLEVQSKFSRYESRNLWQKAFLLIHVISAQEPGAPNGSVPQNICSSCKFLLAGRCEKNNSPWKESVAGKKIIQGVRGDLKSRIAATGYLYGLLTTQDLNCAL